MLTKSIVKVTREVPKNAKCRLSGCNKKDKNDAILRAHVAGYDDFASTARIRCLDEIEIIYTTRFASKTDAIPFIVVPLKNNFLEGHMPFRSPIRSENLPK